MNFKFQLSLLFGLFVLIFACKKETTEINQIANLDFKQQVTKIEFFGEYTKAAAAQMLQAANLGGAVETTCGYSLYRISYKTKTFDNSEVIASGLMAIPKSDHIKGLVSWQHRLPLALVTIFLKKVICPYFFTFVQVSIG